MIYVRVWNSFLQPPVYCLLVWQCKMSAKAMMISLLKALHRFVEPRHATDCGRTEKSKVKESHVWSDSVTGARCCSCSTFLSSTEKNTIWETMCKCQNIAWACFVTVCLVFRLPELGQFTIEKSTQRLLADGLKLCDTIGCGIYSLLRPYKTKNPTKWIWTECIHPCL